METIIDLREFYPGHTGDSVVHVPAEVGALLRDSRRQEENARRRRSYHKDYYSLDCGDGIERYALDRIATPEELLERKDETARVRDALGALSQKQARRIYSHYILGKSKTEIARDEGVTESSIFESIDRGLQNMRKFLAKSQIFPNKTGKISPDR